MFNSSKQYSLRKARQILKSSYKWYQTKRHLLQQTQLNFFESKMQSLDQAILSQDRSSADLQSKELESFVSAHFKKSLWNYFTELTFALAFALLAATIIRAMWFEPYEIPSGSMRPTFEEQDRLTVTKTAFGLNVPLMTKHFYFDPSLVQRTSVFIWSGDRIPNLDSESSFFGFPYTKRFIKRCMGKPGDTLYFYGGKIYGIDQNGNDLVELRDNPWMTKLDNIPFIHFEGRTSFQQNTNIAPQSSQVLFHQFNQPLGRLIFSQGDIKGELFNGQEWIIDQPDALKNAHNEPRTYSDFFGIKNFALARLLSKQQVIEMGLSKEKDLPDGIMYLELRHTPSLSYPKPLLERYGVFLSGYTALIPLQVKHIKTLMDNMYTARFIIKDGRADRYHQEGPIRFNSMSPNFPGIPDGTYEFYYGKAYQIDWGGIPFALKSDHPLYNSKPAFIQKLFNLGIEISNIVSPSSKNKGLFPNRYAYFRNGDLYVMGAPLLTKDDPTLIAFNEREKKKEESSTASEPYIAFKDYGPPIKENGELDKEFIQIFGYKIPEKHYLALGDNHAMSQDSRYFGPIPEANLQGAPSIIIWPPGERWGIPNQKPYPLLTLPRIIVWSLFGLAMLIWYLIHKRNMRTPIFKKLP